MVSLELDKYIIIESKPLLSMYYDVKKPDIKTSKSFSFLSISNDDDESCSAHDKVSLIIQEFKKEINKMIEKGYKPNGTIVVIPFKWSYTSLDATIYETSKLIQAMLLE
jgi:hypothetical protein